MWLNLSVFLLWFMLSGPLWKIFAYFKITTISSTLNSRSFALWVVMFICMIHLKLLLWLVWGRSQDYLIAICRKVMSFPPLNFIDIFVKINCLYIWGSLSRLYSTTDMNIRTPNHTLWVILALQYILKAGKLNCLTLFFLPPTLVFFFPKLI